MTQEYFALAAQAAAALLLATTSVSGEDGIEVLTGSSHAHHESLAELVLVAGLLAFFRCSSPTTARPSQTCGRGI